ncbi:MAG: molybdopterin-guanine dinucleotide biosynthesis protein B [Thermodesulfobacteriota bacterium]|nr:MAG: molybdopterin-guanine dinucleotide biosynthesis protein B [Thermodesulfobacteriota bacterium]
MKPVVTIAGLSGSGKTTLLEKVVTELTSRGFKVGTIKHDVHGFEIDRPGKDSARHGAAGAVSVVLTSPDKMALIKKVSEEWPPERIAATFLDDVDVIVAEGFKGSALPKIEIARKAVSAKPVCETDETLLAYVSDMEIKGERPVFGLDDFKGVAGLIEEKVIKAAPQNSVSLVVDGVPVTLKPFIENLIRDGVLGMIQSLKGCEEAVTIELRIDKR